MLGLTDIILVARSTQLWPDSIWHEMAWSASSNSTIASK